MVQRCKNSNKQLIKCKVLCCSYDKNLWLKCKGCFCFLLYYKMVFIQVFYCSWLQQASLHGCFVSISVTQTQTLFLLYITSKHPCMTEVMKIQSFGSAAHYECVLKPCCCCWGSANTPHVSLCLLLLPWQSLHNYPWHQLFPFFSHSRMTLRKKINSAEFNFKETFVYFLPSKRHCGQISGEPFFKIK